MQGRAVPELRETPHMLACMPCGMVQGRRARLRLPSDLGSAAPCLPSTLALSDSQPPGSCEWPGDWSKPMQIAADGLAEIDEEFRDRLPIKRFHKIWRAVGRCSHGHPARPQLAMAKVISLCKIAACEKVLAVEHSKFGQGWAWFPCPLGREQGDCTVIHFISLYAALPDVRPIVICQCAIIT